MSVIVNAQPAAPRAAQQDSSALGCSILAVGLIVFGLWFGVAKTIEFAAGALYDPEAAIQAEMEFLWRTMNCEPGEVLEIRPLGDGAKAVRCVAGDNMPPGRRDGVRG
jgi:hypothetical protein